jgi:hypothetical protein
MRYSFRGVRKQLTIYGGIFVLEYDRTQYLNHVSLADGTVLPCLRIASYRADVSELASLELRF